MVEIKQQHRMVTTDDGIRWHLVEAGATHKLTLVLIAGFPESAYAWRRVVPILATNYHVLAIDLPGQGYSSVPTTGFDTRTTSQRLNALLKKMHIATRIYIGHDVGAWVGFAFSHLYSDQLLGTVLIDGNIPSVTLPKAIPLNSESWRSWHFLFNALPDLPESLLAGNERKLLDWFFSNKAANWQSSFSKADIDEYENIYRTPGVMRGMLGYYRAVLTDMTIHDQLKQQQIEVPLLAVSGELGSSRDLAEKIAPFCKVSYGETIPDSGHYVPEEAPAVLCQRITAFINRISEK